MYRFTVITTGDTTTKGVAQTQSAIEIAQRHGASVQLVTQAAASQDEPEVPRRLDALWHMMLWGFHHSNTHITVAGIVSRLSLNEATAGLWLMQLVEAKMATRTQVYVDSSSLPLVVFKLTPEGVYAINRIASDILCGGRVVVQTANRGSAKYLVNTLQTTVRGTLICQVQRRPLPTNVEWIVLAAGWLLEQHDLPITMPYVARKIDCAEKSIEFSFNALVRREYLITLKPSECLIRGRGASKDSYALTPQGATIARSYLASLLR